jgi:hypothetical protein
MNVSIEPYAIEAVTLGRESLDRARENSLVEGGLKLNMSKKT